MDSSRSSAKMLLQSHSSEIEVSPALPDAWPTAAVRGLHPREAYTLDFAWKNGSLSSLKIHAKAGGKMKVRYKQTVVEIACKPDPTYLLDGTLRQQ
jgi:alpha-L-fucosidase 2